MKPQTKFVNRFAALVAVSCMSIFALVARAEDGYALWLRYGEVANAKRDATQQPTAIEVRADRSATHAATIDVAVNELRRAQLPAIVLAKVDRLQGEAAKLASGLIGKAAGAYQLATLADGRALIAANDDIGLLYGSFALLRHWQIHGSTQSLNELSVPQLPLRMLNHWDNLDGKVERGYAGRSIFDWWHLPQHVDQRMIDYARANASIGINGTVVNNVNANAEILTPRYIAKLKRLADTFRPYGIRIYVSARFSAPIEIGKLNTADPLDAQVAKWWHAKADEIYAAIPDFGGFLVKANSEGQPGPQDYKRNHADGANMLAQAIGNRGVVIWRAFVYQSSANTDRAMLAYDEFKSLDGKFASNVIVQVKNGPIDFQPREPFHPLFGAMPKTRLMLEAQITKEYLGFASHLVYLAPMWQGALRAETGHGNKQSLLVAQTLNAGGMAGVANTGSDRNWSGSHFDQANWYAFGRLAWNPMLPSDVIAKEWLAQTFSREPEFTSSVIPMMMGSRQAAVDYMTPMGLTHQMATGHHYGPGPWVSELARPEWNPTYYNRADKNGIGFDRTSTGSNALSQYDPSVARQWANPNKIDEEYLLWFHHLPWSFKTQSGRTLWNELIHRYDKGVAYVASMNETWAKQSKFVDPQRYHDTAEFLTIQQTEARWWRDASIAYFASVSGLSLPNNSQHPEHDLTWYKSLRFPEAP
jgi:alpha-glucuronidase